MAKPKNTPATVPALPADGLVRIKNNTAKGIDLIPAGEFEGRTLIPGGNNVALAHVLAVKDHPGMAWYFNRKWLEVEMSGETEAEGVPAPASLMTYEEGPAIEFVRLEKDVDVLRRWLASDERTKVTEAISARIAAIKAA